MSISGTVARKTERQVRNWAKNPPDGLPASIPRPAAMLNLPYPYPTSEGGSRAGMMAYPSAAIPPAPTPWMILPAKSVKKVVDTPQTVVPRVITAIETMKMRFKPNRQPNRPVGIKAVVAPTK